MNRCISPQSILSSLKHSIIPVGTTNLREDALDQENCEWYVLFDIESLIKCKWHFLNTLREEGHIPLNTPSRLTLFNNTKAGAQCLNSLFPNCQRWIPQSNPNSIHKLRHVNIENSWSIFCHFLNFEDRDGNRNGISKYLAHIWNSICYVVDDTEGELRIV